MCVEVVEARVRLHRGTFKAEGGAVTQRILTHVAYTITDAIVILIWPPGLKRNVFSLQALGTAIAATKVMKALQVVKGEDGSEVSKHELVLF